MCKGMFLLLSNFHWEKWFCHWQTENYITFPYLNAAAFNFHVTNIKVTKVAYCKIPISV